VAAKNYQCQNYGSCDLALNHELIEIQDGEEWRCPAGQANCRAGLKEMGDGPPVEWPRWIRYGLTAVAGLAVLGAGTYFLIPQEPDRPAAETMITDFFPRLK